jgi:hypothetical protein
LQVGRKQRLFTRAINLNDLTKFAPISEELSTGLSVKKVEAGMLISYRGLAYKGIECCAIVICSHTASGEE